jgi:hypothetical protein
LLTAWDDALFKMDHAFRPLMRDLVQDLAIQTEAIRLLAFLGLPEDLEWIAEQMPAPKKKMPDDLWAQHVAAAMLEPRTERQWSFLKPPSRLHSAPRAAPQVSGAPQGESVPLIADDDRYHERQNSLAKTAMPAKLAAVEDHYDYDEYFRTRRNEGICRNTDERRRICLGQRVCACPHP